MFLQQWPTQFIFLKLSHLCPFHRYWSQIFSGLFQMVYVLNFSKWYNMFKKQQILKQSCNKDRFIWTELPIVRSKKYLNKLWSTSNTCYYIVHNSLTQGSSGSIHGQKSRITNFIFPIVMIVHLLNRCPHTVSVLLDQFKFVILNRVTGSQVCTLTELSTIYQQTMRWCHQNLKKKKKSEIVDLQPNLNIALTVNIFSVKFIVLRHKVKVRNNLQRVHTNSNNPTP